MVLVLGRQSSVFPILFFEFDKAVGLEVTLYVEYGSVVRGRGCAKKESSIGGYPLEVTVLV
jgi:hypothetical protein